MSARSDARAVPGLRRALAAALVLAALVAATVALGAKAAAPPKRVAPPATYPAGPGQAIAERACLFCHSPMLATQQAKDSTGWEKTLGQMEKWGAPVNGAEHDTLRQYLLARFGPRVPPAAAAPGTPAK